MNNCNWIELKKKTTHLNLLFKILDQNNCVSCLSDFQIDAFLNSVLKKREVTRFAIKDRNKYENYFIKFYYK